MTRLVLALAVLVTGCSFDSTPGAGDFLCSDGVCPRGYGCVDGHCVEGSMPADARPGPDAPPIDAAPPRDGEPDAQVNTDNCTAASLDITALARAPGGVVLHGDTTNYINNLGSPPTYCDLPIQYGADAFYLVQVVAGEHISADLDADFDSSLYLSSGCQTGAQCPCLPAPSACTAGRDITNMSGEHIDWDVTENATYYVVVDGQQDTLAYKGSYRLTVSITTP